MIILDKPKHRKYLFKDLTPDQYVKYARQYSQAKRVGIQSVYAWVGGLEVLDIIKDVSKGIMFDWTKKKLTSLCTSLAFLYVLSIPIVVLSNSKRVIRWSKIIHTSTAFVLECVENASNISYLGLDLMLFGQVIPIGQRSRFDLLGPWL